ncbi:macrophage mannose receptor 1-like isoform X2 [Cyprinodon tularosa]|uniref:macrophage mannose receptor 1-like isoform X2 n=1 Tax=Cyprinodon tularosa TaxID=77115 RepID=UPI0018E22400|nr:macrophage mannose receptor 1-like isoform X2 [Cyprinodon tularosa]
MMEKILLGLLFLLAQTYCRQKHTDLATILNSEQQNQLIDTLTSAGHSSDVWIGLFSEIHWKWSDGYTGSGADYRDWHINQPSWYDLNELCVGSYSYGEWFDATCTGNRQFLCYKGSHLDPEFVYVTTTMSWSDAQSYCRNNFVDLATIKNDTENQRVQSLISSGQYPWIGLYRDANLHWSDGSSVLFSSWDSFGIVIGSRKVICGATSTGISGRWKIFPCETRLQFVCYGPPVTKQIVKLRLHTEDFVELNDPVLRENILKKLQNRLQENGVSGVTLKWREQPDGRIFKKGKKEL